MASASRLQAEVEDLRTREADVKKRLKQLHELNSAAAERKVTPWIREVALKIYALVTLDASVPLLYLSMKEHTSSEDDVRHWFDALSSAGKASLTSPSDDVGKRQLAEATRFVEEHRLTRWISEQNTVKGIAPSPGAVLRHAQAMGLSLPSSFSSRYRWLRRCVRRWGGRCGRFSAGDDLEPDVFEQKAADALSPLARVSRPHI